MSVLLIDSFDDGLLANKWTVVNGASVSTATPRTGTHKLNLLTNANAFVARTLGTGSGDTIIFGGGVNFGGLSTNVKFLHFQSDIGVTTHIGVKVNINGAFEIYRGGNTGTGLGTLIGTTASNLVVINNWYHFEIKVFLNDVTGTVEIRLNHTIIFTFTGDTKNGGTETVISRVVLGASSVSDAAAIAYDDVYILNSAGTSNNNFIGDSRVHNLLPNANGNYSQLLGSDGNMVDNFLQVDETLPNTTDYNGSGISGEKDSYNFPSLPAPVTLVRAVGQRAFAAASDAGARMARNFVRIAGVDYPSADYNLGATYLLFADLFDVSPATAVAFTPVEFNAAEWGFEARA